MANTTRGRLGFEQQAANAQQAKVIEAQSQLLERQQKLILTFAQILNDNGLGHIIDKTANLRFNPPPHEATTGDKISWKGPIDEIMDVNVGDEVACALLLIPDLIDLWNELLNFRYKIPVILAEHEKEKALFDKYYDLEEEWQKRKLAGKEKLEVWDIAQMESDKKAWQRAEKRANELGTEGIKLLELEKSTLNKICRRIGYALTQHGVRRQENSDWIERLKDTMKDDGNGILNYEIPLKEEDFEEPDTDEERPEDNSPRGSSGRWVTLSLSD